MQRAKAAIDREMAQLALRGESKVLTYILARIRDEQGEMASETITEIIQALVHACTLDAGQYLECFCQIPVELVVQMGQEVPSDFLPALRTYVEALDETAGRHAYSFADDVADVMGKVYERCGDIRLRVLALRAIMTAAEQLSRHAPQRLFCRYLERAATFDVALPISEMLVEHGVAGVKRFQGFNYSRYHFMIRQSLDEIDLRDIY